VTAFEWIGFPMALVVQRKIERNFQMPSSLRRDNPDYAVDVMEGAKPIGPQLAVASVLLTVLLAGMSAMDAPMQPRDLYVAGESGTESRPAPEAGLLCSIGDKVKGWVAITAS
jgi:hypothetical protein